MCALKWRKNRFLNNEQALADSANFMANVKFEGIDEDLTAPKTPWIYYGVRVTGIALSSLIEPCFVGLVCGCSLRTDEGGLSSFSLWCHSF